MAEPLIGAEDLRRAFIAAGTTFNAEMRSRLRLFAETVASDAEILAQTNIRNVGVPWSQMRTGATGGRGIPSVYVAPEQRGTRIASRKRRKFARILLTRSMEPALERNRTRIIENVDALLARMQRKFGN